MKDAEIKKGEEFLQSLGYFGISKERYAQLPQAYKYLESMLQCVSMINSVLTYNWNMKDNAEALLEKDKRWRHIDCQTGENEGYLEHYTKILGVDIVIALMKEQMARIKTIEASVYEDGEGLKYNKVEYFDE